MTVPPPPQNGWNPRRRCTWPIALLLIVLFSIGPKQADGHLIRYSGHPTRSVLENREASQERNLGHARYVCKEGGGKHRRWACKARRWIGRELGETRRVLHPPALARITTTGDACLDEIIDRETAGTWNHRIWNYEGSGAYGLPQAKPARKMASAGSDYMTNPQTQIRWMRAYVNGRYGGSCGALAFHNANGWY